MSITSFFKSHMGNVIALSLAFVCLAWFFWSWFSTNSEAVRNLALLIFALVGMPLAVWRTYIANQNTEIANKNSKIANKNTEITDRNSFTDIFTKAIEQLGATTTENKPKIEVRLGAIYALEKLSKANTEYYQPIIDILCSYVRQHAPIPPETEPNESDCTRIDVQTVMTVIGRRTVIADETRLELADVYLPKISLMSANLSEANLNRAVLHKAKLNGAKLRGAELIGANLVAADLNEANLVAADLNEANLVAADLYEANLDRADLCEAKLHEASLYGASLDRAILRKANLHGANLHGTNLEGADLNQANLHGAFLGAAILQKADLGKANLVEADLGKAKLNGALLDDAKLNGAFLGAAILQKANLSGADLVGANLFRADLEGAILTGAIGLTKEELMQAKNWESSTHDLEIMNDYKGYKADIRYSEEDDCLVGWVIGTKDQIIFDGLNLDAIKQSFHTAIDEYLEDCASRGVEPNKPYLSTAKENW